LFCSAFQEKGLADLSEDFVSIHRELGRSILHGKARSLRVELEDLATVPGKIRKRQKMLCRQIA
jgi:hypothetical protein